MAEEIDTLEQPKAAEKAAVRALPWTVRQQAAVWLVVAGVLMVLTVRYWRNPRPVGNDSLADEAPAPLLRVDPNTADWPTLAALPVVGKSLAQRIVERREQLLAENPGRVAFEQLEDMRRVKGIGPATLRAIEPYLVFPATRPAEP